MEGAQPLLYNLSEESFQPKYKLEHKKSWLRYLHAVLISKQAINLEIWIEQIKELNNPDLDQLFLFPGKSLVAQHLIEFILLGSITQPSLWKKNTEKEYSNDPLVIQLITKFQKNWSTNRNKLYKRDLSRFYETEKKLGQYELPNPIIKISKDKLKRRKINEEITTEYSNSIRFFTAGDENNLRLEKQMKKLLQLKWLSIVDHCWENWDDFYTSNNDDPILSKWSETTTALLINNKYEMIFIAWKLQSSLNVSDEYDNLSESFETYLKDLKLFWIETELWHKTWEQLNLYQFKLYSKSQDHMEVDAGTAVAGTVVPCNPTLNNVNNYNEDDDMPPLEPAGTAVPCNPADNDDQGGSKGHRPSHSRHLHGNEKIIMCFKTKSILLWRAEIMSEWLHENKISYTIACTQTDSNYGYIFEQDIDILLKKAPSWIPLATGDSKSDPIDQLQSFISKSSKHPISGMYKWVAKGKLGCDMARDCFQVLDNTRVLMTTYGVSAIGVTLSAGRNQLKFQIETNAGIDEQFNHRSFRLGQSRDVFIYALETIFPDGKPTIERMQAHILQKRKETIRRSIEAGTNQIKVKDDEWELLNDSLKFFL